MLSPSKCLADIIIKPGDTLSKIAQRYNVSLRSLMDLNRIYDADKLKVGQRIKLPGNNNLAIKKSSLTHLVSSGETLSEIAFLYKVNIKDIIYLNKLDDSNFLYLGQELRLPKSALKPKEAAQVVHIVSEGETLNSISKRYNLSMKNIIKFNSLSSPNNIQPGDKIYLYSKTNEKSAMRANSLIDNYTIKEKTSKIIDWRNYGSLKVNFSERKRVDGSFVMPAINKNGNSLFLAINCSYYKITSTKSNNQWKKWFTPKREFEFKLVDDICTKKL
nr:LysM peptidoglycan-binding domain-containing protein [Prochlorococcus marinus]